MAAAAAEGTMKLCVYVLEAKGLRAQAEAYVKLKVGKYRSRTRTVSGGSDLVWNEEFVFKMEDAWEVDGGEEEEANGDQLLTVRVFRRDKTGGGVFGGGNRRLLGRVDVWLSTVFGDERRTLPPTWFPLRRQRGSVCKLDCGMLLPNGIGHISIPSFHASFNDSLPTSLCFFHISKRWFCCLSHQSSENGGSSYLYHITK